MQNTVYIQTNNKQKLGAMIAKHAIESKLKTPGSIAVKYLNVDEMQIFKDFNGARYLFTDTEERVYKDDDLQSFTLSRFLPPELMGFDGKALVIDPDIFALCDIGELFEMDIKDSEIASCRKKAAWDSSLMLLQCNKLTHWKMSEIFRNLKDHTMTYHSLINLVNEPAPIRELPHIWNQHDAYTSETKLIHMTGRLTQPWKTGLPIDFTRNKMPKIFGVFPREWVHTLLGKYPTHYQPHPKIEVQELFFRLAADALRDGAITEDDIKYEISQKNVRADFFALLP